MLDASGGPNSGEGLDAITWRTGAGVLSLGTEDGEFLRSRALLGDNMPPAMAGELDISTVEYLPNGLRIPLRNVPSRSVVQVHFLLAWADKCIEESPSTWFAVDQKAETIVSQLCNGTG